jgi:hypothetical protein
VSPRTTVRLPADLAAMVEARIAAELESGASPRAVQGRAVRALIRAGAVALESGGVAAVELSRPACPVWMVVTLDDACVRAVMVWAGRMVEAGVRREWSRAAAVRALIRASVDSDIPA